MLKPLLAAGLCLLAASLITPAPVLAADAKGVWVRPNGDSKIKISSCGSALCGKLVWLRTPGKDTMNPDASKRARPLVGIQIINTMTPTKKANQWQGTVYNAEDGKIYKAFIELVSANRLKLEGCVLGGLICKGETWNRSN